MGILDDLKQQAENQHDNAASGNKDPGVAAGDFYRDHVKARMCSAFNFLDQLVQQLNTLKLDTRAEYPFKHDGKPVALMQQDYKVYNDSIPDPRQITLAFNCSLVNPTSFEVTGRGAVLTQAELLDRYQFKYEKVEQKDPRQLVIGARFKLIGPLQIKIVLQVDEARHVVKLLISNIAGPGTSQYHLKPEQLDEAFLDHLGKYVLRKESSLFKEKVSADVKAMLRKKVLEEQQARETELQQVEEARKAEEARRKQNSTTEQLKKTVSETMARNTEKLKQAMDEQLGDKTEKLKNIFGKLRSQIVPKKS